MSAELRPAATVVPLRDSAAGLEVLLLQRSAQLKFIGGSWVFPGGAVDAQDIPPDSTAGEESAARHAAVREAEEEAGLQLLPGELIPIAHWTAPKESPRRYATWFFVAVIAGDAEVQIDGGEISRHSWYKPCEALNACKTEKIAFLPPTWVTLEWLSALPDTRSACAHFQSRSPLHFTPRLVINEHGVCNVYSEDVAYADGCLVSPGPRHRFWMGDAWRYEVNF